MREDIVPHAADSADSADAQLWRKVEPVLDELVAELGAKDREAVLLRFYHRKSYAEIAAALATSEEAARKRVDRATEKLRAAFERRGLTVTAGALGGVLFDHVTQAAASGLAGSAAAAAAAAIAVGGGRFAGAAGGGAAFAVANKAMAALAWAKVTTLATVTVAGVVVTAGAVAVAVAIAGGGRGDGGGGMGEVGAGAVAATPAPPAAAGAFDAVAKPFSHDYTGQTPPPIERPATAPTPLAQQAIPAPDPALPSLPIAKGWPLAMPGEVTTSITVADLTGDGAPEIILPVRRRNAQQQLVHPQPNWATQLFAFTAAGATLEGFPIQLVEPIETPSPRGFWSSSPSVYLDADAKAHLVLTLPLAKGTCVVHPDGTVTRLGRGNASMNVPLADVDRDGVPDLIGAGLLTNVHGGAVAGWEVERSLGGYGTSIGDVDLDGDGSLEVFRPSYPFGERNELAELGGFTRLGHSFGSWPATVPVPSYFPPVLGDISGDAKREVVAACGSYLLAWTHDGKPAPGTSTVGAFAAVLKDNITAWQSAPALAPPPARPVPRLRLRPPLQPRALPRMRPPGPGRRGRVVRCHWQTLPSCRINPAPH